MTKLIKNFSDRVIKESGMFRRIVGATVIAMGIAGFTAPAQAAGDAPEIAKQNWSFNGFFGTYDRAQLQRGYQVYKEVCAGCHAMSFLAYRNLMEKGGPEFTPEQVKAMAAENTVMDGPNDEGEMFERPALPKDRFVSPFPNIEAARAGNNGAYPVDLSLVAKARAGGPDYIYALLTGYVDKPAGFKMANDDLYYNAAFPGHQIAMAPPISDDQVEYEDGTKASLSNIAKDVSAFLMWAAEPKLEERKRLGFKVMIFLVIFAGMLYFSTKKLWARVKKA